MPKRTSVTGSELFIVDNSNDDWKVHRYLHDWCQISKGIDIATGYFEIGSLLGLDGEWQKVDGIRILMGDEVALQTKKAFEAGLSNVTDRLDESLESEKEKNDFLSGVADVVAAIRSGKIHCRVYRKDKFHAKAYITHARLEVVGSSALVGSSNFTFPGLTENIELNVQITGAQVNVLQEWYEEHWERAEDVTTEVLRTIERHVQEYIPFDVYARSLQEFFRGHEMTVSEWERSVSKVYPILASYQQRAYHGLMRRAEHYNGAFLCDGVGLGKTFVGLMLIERLILHDRKNVVLFVPKAARGPVWEKELNERIPHIFGTFSKLEIFNHTDLLRGGDFQRDLDNIAERADAVIIDEAHHFRNTGIKGEDGSTRQSRYWRLYDIIGDKAVFMLTATPINNRLTDLQHMIELFSRHKPDYFKDAPLGIHSLPGHFRKMEKGLEESLKGRQSGDEFVETNLVEAEAVLSQSNLFQELVVQRSRAYVKKSLQREGGQEILFPKPREPKVVDYSVKRTYGKVLSMIEKAFNKDKPLFSLAIYYPYAYYKGDDKSIDPLEMGRQIQVVSLIRTGFLKRFESSVEGFTLSCWTLLQKLLAWVEVHAETGAEKKQIDRWKRQNDDLLRYAQEHRRELFGEIDEEEIDEDIIPPEMLEAVEERKLNRNEFKVEEIIGETILDLDQAAEFLKELQAFKPADDKKLAELLKLIKTDPVLSKHKLLIFTEFMDTARYLKKELIAAGIEGVEEIDSGIKGDRGRIIRRFSPYYNGSSSAQLAKDGIEEIRVLVSTDVLSEGLNLQDATRLINYDLHWNPVRLMQRIGRVDRRMNPAIEERIKADHPDQAPLRGEVAYWNFLPPEELDTLLKLYSKVTKKTLRISKTFGIEGKKLLKPDDDFEDLRDFMGEYEGSVSPFEAMHLELQRLYAEDPSLETRLRKLPNRVFSGKKSPSPDARAIFFCYALPARKLGEGIAPEEAEWSIESGIVQWYLYDLATETISEDPAKIFEFIRSEPETPRHCTMQQSTLSEIRSRLDKHIRTSYLRKVDAPSGVKPVLRAWMELA